MCSRNPDNRIQSFFDIEKEIQNNRFFEISFNDQELTCYRNFADQMQNSITKIKNGTKYVNDFEAIQTQLENAYRSFMLEETIPNASNIINYFLAGVYYFKKNEFPVETVKEFVRLLKSVTHDKKRIIFANLHTRFDAIPRYIETDTTDDIPF